MPSGSSIIEYISNDANRPRNNKHIHFYVTYCMSGYINYILSTLINSYIPQCNHTRWILLLSLLYRSGNWGTRRKIIMLKNYQWADWGFYSSSLLYSSSVQWKFQWWWKCFESLLLARKPPPTCAIEHLKCGSWDTWILHFNFDLLYLNLDRHMWLVRTVLDNTVS